MKVNIYYTAEVSDEQRVAIAAEIDGSGAKKRNATRDEMKAYILREGEGWAESLADASEPVEEPATELVPEDEPEFSEDDLDENDLL